jgi:hypothetical protein
VPAAPLPVVHAALHAAVVAMRDTHAPELHVYDLWRPDLALPAAYWWLGEGGLPERPDDCTVVQPIRFVLCIAVDPATTVAEDARRLLDYVQLAWDALDPVIYAARLAGAGPNRARWAAGLQLVQDTIGGAPVTVAELPVEVPIRRTVIPNP